MDYEKAYKAVLKTATQWIKDGCTDKERICLESVFPELRESEDERIRKFICSIIDNLEPKDFVGVKKMNVLAWLEKQKEPHYTKRNALFDKCVANCDPEIMKEVSDEIDSQLNKEQKPDDNQFPPLDGLDAIKAQYYDRGFKNGFDEGVDSVKPAEWSEEDEKMLDKVCCLINPGTILNASDADYCLELKQWIVSLQERILNSLRPSWKPSEERPQVADASKMEPEVDFEKASRNVYESWKGGTMDDFLRDMVELGKVLNARKEE